MKIESIIFWLIISIIIVIAFNVQPPCDESNDSSNYREGFGDTSILNESYRNRNYDLAIKCGRMFNGYPKYMQLCSTTDGQYLEYAVGIENAHAIWNQNYRDGIEWPLEIYLALVIDRASDMICEIVYPKSYRSGCHKMSEGMRREAWEQYWDLRKKNSNNWQLSDAHTRLR